MGFCTPVALDCLRSQILKVREARTRSLPDFSEKLKICAAIQLMRFMQSLRYCPDADDRDLQGYRKHLAGLIRTEADWFLGAFLDPMTTEELATEMSDPSTPSSAANLLMSHYCLRVGVEDEEWGKVINRDVVPLLRLMQS